MRDIDFASMDDEGLLELIFTIEDRLPLEGALELARRDHLAPFLGQLITDKQSWLAELPTWWAVVHATYILGYRADSESIIPMLGTLRWADAFDCDWVTEVLPSIFAKLGPQAISGLTMVLRDLSAGWSVRDTAMKSLAAISLKHKDSEEHVFRLIGERLMDEREDRTVRQLAGRILLDFRRHDYRLALIKFSREDLAYQDMGYAMVESFGPDEVEWLFRQPGKETWVYEEDWMRFYDPADIQRRQKRWFREKMSGGRGLSNGGGGQVVPIWNHGKNPHQTGHDKEGPGKE